MLLLSVKNHVKGAAASLGIPDIQRDILEFGKPGGNGQAKTKVRFYISRLILAVKCIENQRFVLVADSRTKVCYGCDDAGGRGFDV